MESILYENFLQNAAIYKDVVDFWEKEVQEVLDEFGLKQHFIWRLDQDGNPIFATKIIRGKAIRIIQDEMDDLTYVNAWVKTTEDRQAWPIEELVIRIVLTTKTKETALNLIREWAKPQTTTSAINLYIENHL